jgi:hypothetical protein
MFPTAANIDAEVMIELEIILNVVAFVPHPQIHLRVANGREGRARHAKQQIGNGVSTIGSVEADVGGCPILVHVNRFVADVEAGGDLMSSLLVHQRFRPHVHAFANDVGAFCRARVGIVRHSD